MSDEGHQEVHQFGEVDAGGMVPEEHLFYDDLRNVHLTITADLGFAPMLVRDVLELKQGSVIPLNKLAGEMTDICVNGVPLARGEVVVIADGIHIRIGEILGAITVDKESTEDDY